MYTAIWNLVTFILRQQSRIKPGQNNELGDNRPISGTLAGTMAESHSATSRVAPQALDRGFGVGYSVNFGKRRSIRLRHHAVDAGAGGTGGVG
jgi:hypothetical protein